MTTPISLIGTQLGPYQIQALLGSGGMATVYQGLDTHLQRPVAVKVLSAALAGDPDYVRRFKREAQLIASLRHPNVAQVYAFGEQHGAPYMVQELLPGPTLEARLQNLAAASQLMPRLEVLAVVAQLAAALDAAHAIGVIHRDVKPSNAIANAQGELVLTDFGIARSAADTTLTQPGIVLGTPAYVAPEQAIGSAALTPAADLYALGVLLFQLLTGHMPFEAGTPAAVMIKHLYEAPAAPSQLRPDLPPTLDAVVLRALEKEPAARYQRAGDLAAALAQAWPAAAVPAPAPIHSLPTTAWSPPPAAAQPPVHEGPTRVWQPGAPTRPVAPSAPAQAPLPSATPRVSTQAPLPSAAPPPSAPARGRGSPLPWLGAALLVLLFAGALAAWRGTVSGQPEAAPAPQAPGVLVEPAPSTEEGPTAVSAPVAPDPAATVPSAVDPVAPDPAATSGPVAPNPAGSAGGAPDPVAPDPAATVPSAADPAAPTADPLDSLGSLISAGLADGSAGDDAPEYFQRYGYLVEAIGSGDEKRASEEIRELSRKIAERAREGKLDPAFNTQAQALLLAVADQYGLKRPNAKKD